MKTEKKYNYEKVKQATKLLLEGIGDDPNRDGLKDTPDRVAKMYGKIFNGYDEDPSMHIKLFDSNSNDPVIVKDIKMYSMCEHHLVLFVGNMAIGYIPKNKVIGLSKLIRIARVFAKRPQIQERLVQQIHDAISELVPNDGVAVWYAAEHFCMSIRGTRLPGTTTVTHKLSGKFKDDAKVRNEFFNSLK